LNILNLNIENWSLLADHELELKRAESIDFVLFDLLVDISPTNITGILDDTVNQSTFAQEANV